jgi:ornithine cyclodeaminase/alanine dehydrogenase-like protein (mu-crystallin family)
MAGGRLLYLSAGQVARALDDIDVVEPVAAALRAHAGGRTVLPSEAHLAWERWNGPARSLSMPGLLDGCPGVKIINANPANPARGLPRASGLIVLFDIDTAEPICVLEAARISCLRTAAVSAIAAAALGRHPIQRLALLGAGALAHGHIELLAGRLPELDEIRVYDRDPARAAALAADIPDPRIVTCRSAERAVRGAQLVIPVTTTRRGYICHHWLDPGALLVNVSLDDPLPELVLQADKLFVDDWQLIVEDRRRLLGRMARAGQVRGPGDPPSGARAIDGELGQVLTDTCAGRTRDEEIIVLNPFGLAIEDLALAQAVHQHALEHGLGTTLPR